MSTPTSPATADVQVRGLASPDGQFQAIHDAIAEADRGEFASSEEVAAVFAKYTVLAVG